MELWLLGAVGAFLVTVVVLMALVAAVFGPDEDLVNPWDPYEDAKRRRAAREDDR